MKTREGDEMSWEELSWGISWAEKSWQELRRAELRRAEKRTEEERGGEKRRDEMRWREMRAVGREETRWEGKCAQKNPRARNEQRKRCHMASRDCVSSKGVEHTAPPVFWPTRFKFRSLRVRLSRSLLVWHTVTYYHLWNAEFSFACKKQNILKHL